MEIRNVVVFVVYIINKFRENVYLYGDFLLTINIFINFEFLRFIWFIFVMDIVYVVYYIVFLVILLEIKKMIILDLIKSCVLYLKNVKECFMVFMNKIFLFLKLYFN